MKRVDNVAKICAFVASAVFFSKVLKPFAVPLVRQFEY